MSDEVKVIGDCLLEEDDKLYLNLGFPEKDEFLVVITPFSFHFTYIEGEEGIVEGPKLCYQYKDNSLRPICDVSFKEMVAMVPSRRDNILSEEFVRGNLEEPYFMDKYDRVVNSIY